ncbi:MULTISPECIES: phosphoadenosine phosphosulfate reductase family protein [Fusobacterium]|uniref:phosphoadenosine phosphosulfate reductase domain-containing protein n=1 Tax=Fusobacterium TaxID=848 RepID=UPI001477108D|nr:MULTISPECIES: phosphoadenosine phosphosulfate reductase family protein [Fusobacterium]NME35040.1 phosphoadenosine phosphosulfate reductase family protein [Fusobacterium sp. FSA-380-WT-3A]
MWCKKCNRETQEEICEICGSPTESDIPINIYWCPDCNIPIIKEENAIDKLKCPHCKGKLKYLSTDLRPVFPEERLLIEILLDKPMEFYKDSVWVSDNRYYINGEVIMINSKLYKKYSSDYILKKLEEYKNQNTYEYFDKHIEKFTEANKERLNYLYDEACEFIKNTRKNFPLENIILSFSGGKDSTVTADLVVRALSEPSLVHIFGDTTLEFPMTQEYVKRFREKNMMSIFKVCKNREQDFFKVCEDIGPPARMLRWCCSMFKTGPITRVLNNLYKDKDVLTFYGIRKCESVSRSKYNRVENKAGSVKINKQTVASPIFYWKDIDIWLYMLTEKIDFNDAYRLGYDRVGCWCCPNNGERAVFLSNIYMPEKSKKWRDFLIRFAKQIGKADPEVYVDTGKWKARQGGNGIKAANDVKIKFANCTTEENAKVYQLNKEIPDWFYTLFIPFGKLAPELGRKLLKEMIIVDVKTNIPIISIQPFSQDGFEYSVKIKTMNVKNHEDLQRQISYQIKKFNACRKCLKCESLCKHGAISIIGDEYFINNEKCKRCKMCISPKYLTGGCLMERYLKTRTE